MRIKQWYILVVATLLVAGCGANPPAVAPSASAATPAAPAAVAQPTTAPATLAPTSAPAPLTIAFTHPTNDPIVARGSVQSWDSPFNDPGAVVFHDGMFHMFRNGFRAWPASVQIGYATSADGKTWAKQDAQPVLKTEQVPYAGVAALASSVLVQDDGTWVLYFYTWGTSSTLAPGAIGRATAPKPTGPWTPDPKPVLEPGAAGAWDDQNVRAPHVIRANGEYRMYYSGASKKDNVDMIGLATSTDGVAWQKNDDPATTDGPFAASDPIFTPAKSGAWDAGFVHQPRVVPAPGGWAMLYRGNVGRQRGTMGIGLATSSDGIHWERAGDKPILTAKAIGKSNFYFTNVLEHEGTIFLFWEVEAGSGTDIHLATAENELN